jgi:hypothetical protein
VVIRFHSRRVLPILIFIPAEKKERENRDKEERLRAAKEEAERIAAEKKKKKPIRYPTEDLDVRLTEKDKKAGMKVKRPVPSLVALPFNDTFGTFEAFLMAWNFLIAYGYAPNFFSASSPLTILSNPLHLSTFNLDEFEHAIRHSIPDTHCPLLAEVHATLIYNLRTVPFQRHSALLSLLRLKDEIEDSGQEDEAILGVSIDDLSGAMADVGNNWERVPLRHNEGREGWEDALVGCLKDVRDFSSLLVHLCDSFLACYSAELPSSKRDSHTPSFCPGGCRIFVEFKFLPSNDTCRAKPQRCCIARGSVCCSALSRSDRYSLVYV